MILVSEKLDGMLSVLLAGTTEKDPGLLSIQLVCASEKLRDMW